MALIKHRVKQETFPERRSSFATAFRSLQEAGKRHDYIMVDRCPDKNMFRAAASADLDDYSSIPDDRQIIRRTPGKTQNTDV